MDAAEFVKHGEEALSLAWSSAELPSLPGREDEVSSIVDFCASHLRAGSSGSIYVCGCPGTGKTLAAKKAAALLAAEWRKEQEKEDLQVITINCMSLSDPQLLLETIAERTRLPESSDHGRPKKKLKRCSAPIEDTPVLVIVDEVDYLVKSSRDQQLLQELFLLPSQLGRRCLLIGISNTLHLVEKFLPRLKALKCAPKTITFSAYSQDQVLDVLKLRLQTAPTESQGSLVDLFHPKALELCAKKVAASSGDMRKALDACRHSLNSAYAERLEEGSVHGHGVEPAQAQLEPTRETSAHKMGLQVGIGHMAHALASTLSTPVLDTIRSLPLHQQMILSALVVDAKSRRKESLQQELFTTYCKLHKQQSLVPLSYGEFSMLCQTLADLGLVRLSGSSPKSSSKRKIKLGTEQDDVAFALQGVRLFRSILCF